jgi:hypothetical protein
MTVTSAHTPPGRGAGRHRRLLHRPAGAVALGAALAIGAVLLALPPVGEPLAAGPLTLSAAWPSARVGPLPASMPDGPAYSPLYLLDVRTSVGTAPTADGTRLRLLLRIGDGAPRELRSLAMDADPLFGGLTSAGDLIVWAETTTETGGRTVTRLYAVDRRSAAPPRLLTGDTGAIAFFNSQYDLVIADDRVHWVAVGPSEEPVTELRSVPLAGGTVTTRTEPGPWARSAWPWLVSAVTVQSGEAQLRDLVARKRFTVPAAATELVTCSPRWCRVQVIAGGGPARLDLMRPDGTDRRRIAGPTETAAVVDVAVLDRFEVLTRAGQGGGAVNDQDLLLYDVQTQRTAAVATGVGTVVCRAGLLWWSTGDVDDAAWHSLDLRTLT